MIWSGEASFILLSEDEREMEDTLIRLAVNITLSIFVLKG